MDHFNNRTLQSFISCYFRVMGMLRNLYQKCYQWGPALIGFTSILAFLLLKGFPGIADMVYRRMIFASYRWIHDSLFAWLPIPMILILAIMAFTLTIRRWVRHRHQEFRPWYRGLLNALGIIVAWFYLSWGFNYAAPGIDDQLELSHAAAEPILLTHAFQTGISRARNAREEADTNRFRTKQMTNDERNSIHASVREYLRSIGFQTPGNVALRSVSKRGWMRKLGVAGIYLPFSGEAHADASYPLLQQWFTVAHEYAHGYGITGEGECNFVAFMALKDCGVDKLEYAAWYQLVRSLAFRVDSVQFAQIPDGVKRDQLMLREDALNYKSIAPELSHLTNDIYLKTQGVRGGISNYRSWIDLVLHADSSYFADFQP